MAQRQKQLNCWKPQMMIEGVWQVEPGDYGAQQQTGASTGTTALLYTYGPLEGFTSVANLHH